jgi:hypothetical protein
MAVNNLIVEPIIKYYSSILDSGSNPQNVIPLENRSSLKNVLLARTLMQNSINELSMLTEAARFAKMNLGINELPRMRLTINIAADLKREVSDQI